MAGGARRGGNAHPPGDLASRLAEIPRSREVLLFCRSGNRSGKATEFLRAHGLGRARNVQGGVVAWTGRGLPVVIEDSGNTRDGCLSGRAG